MVTRNVSLVFIGNAPCGTKHLYATATNPVFGPDGKQMLKTDGRKIENKLTMRLLGDELVVDDDENLTSLQIRIWWTKNGQQHEIPCFLVPLRMPMPGSNVSQFNVYVDFNEPVSVRVEPLVNVRVTFIVASDPDDPNRSVIKKKEGIAEREVTLAKTVRSASHTLAMRLHHDGRLTIDDASHTNLICKIRIDKQLDKLDKQLEKILEIPLKTQDPTKLHFNAYLYVNSLGGEANVIVEPVRDVKVTFTLDDAPADVTERCVSGLNGELIGKTIMNENWKKNSLTLGMHWPPEGQLKINNADLKVQISWKLCSKSNETTLEIPLKMSNAFDASMLQFNVHLRFDAVLKNYKVDVEPILGYYQFPTNSIKNYFGSLAKALGIEGKKTRKMFARRLVPAITIKGNYDERYGSSRPNELHKILGDAALNNNESAIQHVQKQCPIYGPEKAREFISKALNNEYHRRDREIFNQFIGQKEHFPYKLPEDNKNPLLQTIDGHNLKEDDFFKVLLHLGRQIIIKNDTQAKFLLVHAHAIIRGRLETFSAAPNFNLMSQEFGIEWRRHMRAVGAWFVFMVRIFIKSRDERLVTVKTFHNFVTSPNKDPPRISIDLHGKVEAIRDPPIDLNSFTLDHTEILPRENVLQYFHQRINITGLDVPFDQVKYIYAQSLVPTLNLEDGSYNQTLNAYKKLNLSELYAHDPDHPITNSAVKTIQDLEKDRVKSDTVVKSLNARQIIQQRLQSKFQERQNQIAQGLLQKENIINNLFFIVRGRLEYMTTMEIDLLKPNGFQLWKTELKAAGDYFEKMMHAVCEQHLLDNPNSTREKRFKELMNIA